MVLFKEGAVKEMDVSPEFGERIVPVDALEISDVIIERSFDRACTCSLCPYCNAQRNVKHPPKEPMDTPHGAVGFLSDVVMLIQTPSPLD